jgi:hypothetical protein
MWPVAESSFRSIRGFESVVGRRRGFLTFSEGVREGDWCGNFVCGGSRVRIRRLGVVWERREWIFADEM